jgi:2-oxoglutarate dehydrogenase E2 component (dihydrolipoamide succinyltransferase)
MPVNIVVPEVGESIVDARVAKWLKNEGDAIAAGDPLVELETDKIDLEVAAPQAGVLARIDHNAGADVKVGDVLGVIQDSKPGAAAEGLPPAENEAADATPAQGAETATGAGAAKTRATPTARKAAEHNAVDLANL